MAGSKVFIEALLQFARSYIYTTALPAAYAYALLQALAVLKNADDRRQVLQSRIHYFRQLAEHYGVPLLPSQTAIQSVVLPSAQDSVRIDHELRSKGFLVIAMRPPTVPPKNSRLRIVLNYGHSESHIERLCQSLADVW